MKNWFLVLCLSLSAPLFADNGQILRVVLDKIKYEQWNNAKSFAAHANDPIVMEIYDWYALRAGIGAYQDYKVFLSENSDWPGLPLMQKRVERRLPDNLPSIEVIDFFNLIPSQTPEGLARLVAAYSDIGDFEKANEVYLEGAARLEIPVFVMNTISASLPDFEEGNIYAHVNHLLFEGQFEMAKEYLPLLSVEQQKIVDDRISIAANGAVKPIENEATIEDETETIDATNEDELDAEVSTEETVNVVKPDIPEIEFEKFRYAFKNKNRRGARAILLERSISREALGNPEYWSQDDRRVRLSGDAIWERNYKEAYQIASQHFLEDDEDGYAQAEWKSGFIALEFLGDKEQARKHFENFKNAVNTPISNGRAGYWLGRAGDEGGYAYGAQFQTSFYGQLAAEAGGIDYDMNLLNAEKPSYLRTELLSKDSVHAGLIFSSAGEVLLADRFFRHEAETLSSMDAEALGLLALDLDLPHAAVGIGKNLARRNEIITHSYYPMPELFNQPIPVQKGLAYAITRQESEFYQRAGSSVGARGYMQLMPATAELMATREGVPFVERDLLSNGGYNIRLGTAYLDEMSEKFNGRLVLMAVGYNAGPGRSISWQDHNGTVGPTVEDAVRWVELIPFEETHNYVQRVLEGVFIYGAKLAGEFAYNPSDLLLKAYASPE